jgi:hypothetical protein
LIEQRIFPNGTVAPASAHHLKGWESDLALRVAMPGGSSLLLIYCINTFYKYYVNKIRVLRWNESNSTRLVGDPLLPLLDADGRIGHCARGDGTLGQYLLYLHL